MEAFEGLELGEGKPSRPVLRGPGGRKAAWLLGSYWRRATAAPIRPPIYETGSGWKKMKHVKLREGYQLERGDQLFLRK